uniref:Cytochrome b6-f complex subunit 6 n=1 Tax=Rhodochaete parvula TaxID=110510 RepID=A0A1X9PUZ4_9RHOD|nr:cytochrome b6f complex subunit 6 [Rhodochaete parvula]ASK39586.1 cytochrome b6-f complex subunit VI [Rhodochaete parvula]
MSIVFSYIFLMVCFFALSLGLFVSLKSIKLI